VRANLTNLRVEPVTAGRARISSSTFIALCSVAANRGGSNLTVADLHSYYVLAGVSPVLVHNTCGPNASNRPSQIAAHFGYSTAQIKDAIH
jgi:hypothetical protein